MKGERKGRVLKEKEMEEYERLMKGKSGRRVLYDRRKKGESGG